MRARSGSPQQAFTLIEVLITVVVLSTGLVLVLQGLHTVLHVWQGGVERTRATMAAQERFARIRHEAVLGVAPRSGDGIVVETQVGTHAGLYRVTYQVPEKDVYARGLEMLVYIAPEKSEEGP